MNSRPIRFRALLVAGALIIAAMDLLIYLNLDASSSSSRGLRVMEMDDHVTNQALESVLDNGEKNRRELEGGETTLELNPSCPVRPRPPAFPGKKGACLTMREPGHKNGGSYLENMPKVKALKPYWNYAWAHKRPPNQLDHIEFVPMLYATWGDVQQKLIEHIIPAIEIGNITRLLGYNEPGSERQGNVPIQRGIDFWPFLEAMGVPLVSPSPVRRNQWMDDFMVAAEDKCMRVDYMGVHWYGAANANSFKEEMQVTYEQYGRRPLVITEFAPADWTATTLQEHKWSREKVLAFMKEVLPWLEQTEWIAGYAWFSFKPWDPHGTSSALFKEDHTLNALGRFYASVTTENPYGDISIQVDDEFEFGK